MSRVTGKFQITLPKRLIDAYGIRVGDEVDLIAAGDAITIVPARARSAPLGLSLQERLHYFDEATRRQRERNSSHAPSVSDDRGWTRDGSTIVAGLVDTNILVYRYDPRFPHKQAVATDLLRQGIADKSLFLPHQALIEFVAVVTRPLCGGGLPLLTAEQAHREVEDMLVQFPVIYPGENTVRMALRGAALYRLSWFDAHLWSYADERGLDTLWSEDFEDGRMYGRVRARNPFRSSVHESAATPYGR